MRDVFSSDIPYERARLEREILENDTIKYDSYFHLAVLQCSNADSHVSSLVKLYHFGI